MGSKVSVKDQPAIKLPSGESSAKLGAHLSAMLDQTASHSFLPREPDTCTLEHVHSMICITQSPMAMVDGLAMIESGRHLLTTCTKETRESAITQEVMDLACGEEPTRHGASSNVTMTPDASLTCLPKVTSTCTPVHASCMLAPTQLAMAMVDGLVTTRFQRPMPLSTLITKVSAKVIEVSHLDKLDTFQSSGALTNATPPPRATHSFTLREPSTCTLVPVLGMMPTTQRPMATLAGPATTSKKSPIFSLRNNNSMSSIWSSISMQKWTSLSTDHPLTIFSKNIFTKFSLMSSDLINYDILN